MLRRIAGNLFWLARYLERAEWRARLVDANYRLLVENPGSRKDELWPLLTVTGEWELFCEDYDTADERSILAFLTFDRRNRSSIASCLEYARANCRAARNRISSELWLEINTLHLEARRWNSDLLLSHGLMAFFAELRQHFYRISGLIENTLPRDLGYDFLSLGKWLEAAENVTRLLDTRYHFLLPHPRDIGSPLDFAQWTALLRSASALESYRNTYGNQIAIERVVEFMLFNPTFPRAARFCIDHLQSALKRTPGAWNGETEIIKSAAVDVPAADNLFNKLRSGTAAAAIAGGLHEYLLEIQNDCAAISDQISAAFFTGE